MANTKPKKTRLTKANREWLDRLSQASIKDKPDEQEAFVKAAKLAEKEIVRCLKKAVPKSHMNILKLYGFGKTSPEAVYVSLAPSAEHQYMRQATYHMGGSPNAQWRDQWKLFKPVEITLPQRDYRVKLDAQATVAFDDWASRLAARERRLEEIKVAMRDLIYNAPNLEMIEEVWPDAAKLRPHLPPVETLPAVIAANAMDKVREALLAKQL